MHKVLFNSQWLTQSQHLHDHWNWKTSPALSSSRLTFLQSCTGTGKSTFINNIIQQTYAEQSVLYITTSVAASRAASDNLDNSFTHYIDDSTSASSGYHDQGAFLEETVDAGFTKTTHPRLILGIRSLARLTDVIYEKRDEIAYDVVVFEEAASIVSYMNMTDTKSGGSSSNFALINRDILLAFINTIQMAKMEVIVTDQTLSPQIRDVFIHAASGSIAESDFWFFQNQFYPRRFDVNIFLDSGGIDNRLCFHYMKEFGYPRSDFAKALCAKIKQQHAPNATSWLKTLKTFCQHRTATVAIAVSSLKEAELLVNVISLWTSETDVIIISSKSKRASIQTINTTKIVVYTPALDVAYSIRKRNALFVLANIGKLYTSKTNIIHSDMPGVLSLSQMIGRVRKVKQVYLTVVGHTHRNTSVCSSPPLATQTSGGPMGNRVRTVKHSVETANHQMVSQQASLPTFLNSLINTIHPHIITATVTNEDGKTAQYNQQDFTTGTFKFKGGPVKTLKEEAHKFCTIMTDEHKTLQEKQCQQAKREYFKCAMGGYREIDKSKIVSHATKLLNTPLGWCCLFSVAFKSVDTALIRQFFSTDFKHRQQRQQQHQHPQQTPAKLKSNSYIGRGGSTAASNKKVDIYQFVFDIYIILTTIFGNPRQLDQVVQELEHRFKTKWFPYAATRFGFIYNKSKPNIATDVLHLVFGTDKFTATTKSCRHEQLGNYFLQQSTFYRPAIKLFTGQHLRTLAEWQTAIFSTGLIHMPLKEPQLYFTTSSQADFPNNAESSSTWSLTSQQTQSQTQTSNSSDPDQPTTSNPATPSTIIPQSFTSHSSSSGDTLFPRSPLGE